MTWLAKIDSQNAGFLIGALAVCVVLIWWWKTAIQQKLSRDANAILEKARRDADELLRNSRLTANEDSQKVREQTEQSFAVRRRELMELEQRLAQRETLINTQLERLVEAEKNLEVQKAGLQKQAQALTTQQKEMESLTHKRREQLQGLSGMTEAEARAQFFKEIEREALQDAGDLSRHIVDEAKTCAEEKARQIISVAIQRYAGEHSSETSTATITLQGEDMKGRIIGRDGRNIRAFEASTGITVLIDDTPNAVVLSGFDPVRREIAREAMTRLILDGRIHPTRIEEVVAKVTEETEEAIIRLGEKAVAKAGLPPVNTEVVKLLGKLHFRHSYSQNVLDHSIEVAQLMGLMAAELGVDIQLAKRAGLFHDIGKAVSHEVEGPHAIVGANFLKSHGESEAVVNGVASHHNEVPPIGPLGILVSAADAISASRPGARSETMTTYIKRVEDLEKIALGFAGVEKCFAVQAGRELRVIVRPEVINDEQAFALARNIALKIEDGMQYPGQIKVTVIRETRCVEVAK